MSDSQPQLTCLERVSAELRIYSGDIDPAAVSQRLGLSATTALRRGASITNSLGRTRVHKLNAWFLSSESEVPSTNPEDHLAWLVRKVALTIPALSALLACPGVTAMVVCTCWTTTAGASVAIASPTMRALAELGVDVHIAFASYEDEKSP